MLTKEGIRLLYKGTGHWDCNCLSAPSGEGGGVDEQKQQFPRTDNGILCDLKHSRQHWIPHISSLPNTHATSIMPVSQILWIYCFSFLIKKKIPPNGQKK